MQLEFYLELRGDQRTERPGGRTARTRASVLEAARVEFAESGYAGTTVEKIALRAGVAKTTVYRRWGNLEGIVVDLMDELGAESMPEPDTGEVRTDLRELARGIFVLYKDPVLCAMIEVMATAGVDTPAARQALTAFFAGRAGATGAVVERAVQRGSSRPTPILPRWCGC